MSESNTPPGGAPQVDDRDFLLATIKVEDRSYGSLYPVIQWINGNPIAAPLGTDALPYTGGFFWAAEAMLDIPDARPYRHVTRKAESIDGFGMRRMKMAVLRWRRCFEVDSGENFPVRYAQSEFTEAQEAGKARGLVHILAVPHGTTEPVLLSFRGFAATAMVGQRSKEPGAIIDFGQNVVNAATRLAQKAGKKVQYPTCAFWLTIGAGEEEGGAPKFTEVGDKETSLVTLPTWADAPDTAITEEALRTLFVGHANLAAFQNLFEGAEAWVREWDEANLSELRARRGGKTAVKPVDGAAGAVVDGKGGLPGATQNPF